MRFGDTLDLDEKLTVRLEFKVRFTFYRIVFYNMF